MYVHIHIYIYLYMCCRGTARVCPMDTMTDRSRSPRSSPVIACVVTCVICVVMCVICVVICVTCGIMFVICVVMCVICVVIRLIRVASRGLRAPTKPVFRTRKTGYGCGRQVMGTVAPAPLGWILPRASARWTQPRVQV